MSDRLWLGAALTLALASGCITRTIDFEVSRDGGSADMAAPPDLWWSCSVKEQLDSRCWLCTELGSGMLSKDCEDLVCKIGMDKGPGYYCQNCAWSKHLDHPCIVCWDDTGSKVIKDTCAGLDLGP